MKKSQRIINRYLSLSQAARVVGTRRRTLQKRIQDGEILTFEGMVSLEELLKAYPQTEIEDNTMIEHSRHLKDAAFNRILHDSTEVPDIDVLSARVNSLSQDLNETRAVAKKYVDIVDTLKNMLQDYSSTPQIEELRHWLHKVTDTPHADVRASSRLLASDTLLRLMTAHVRILPSGHDFFVEGTSNLLEAGLRAGLALNYACSNGNCGKCKARLVSGEVRQVNHHDFVLSEEQKATGHFLMCCNEAISDVVVEAIEASGSHDIPEQQIAAKVKKIEFPDDKVALLHLRTPRTSRLRFLAGQYVTLGNNNGVPMAEHSIGSCPCDDMNLHFQVPKVSGDAFSEYVFNQLKAGETVDVTGPRGEFVLDEHSVRSLVFITWHTGFAPVKSLIEHAMALDDAEHLHLFWISKTPGDRYLENLCRSWQDALDNFHYHPIDADLSSDDADEIQHVLDEICNTIEQPQDYDYYVAGRSALITACSNMAQSRGVSPDQMLGDTIRHE